MKPVLVLAIFTIGASLRAAPMAGPEHASWAVLDQAANSHEVHERLEAVAALGSMGAQNQRAVDRMVVFLKTDKCTRVRKAAALGLGNMKAKQAIPALRAALKDKEDEVSFAAAQSLVSLGDPTGQAMVVAVMSGQRSASPGFVTNARREAARRVNHPQTMAFAGVAGAAGAAFPPALPAVAVVSYAGRFNGDRDPGDVAAVDSIADDPNPYNVGLLERALGSKRAPVRAEAAKSLGERGNLATIPRLEPLLKDKSANVRTMAAASIVRLSHPAEPQALAGGMAAPYAAAAAGIAPR
jgi:HEAT repeat protein